MIDGFEGLKEGTYLRKPLKLGGNDGLVTSVHFIGHCTGCGGGGRGGDCDGDGAYER